ncbi:hypothetical protein SLEP1_g13215 [Rubroshorea leprosula]|uniref:Uncharacterized protein n=1 Tax=Rubroshorea leprosula TaxID=152421 RepID=A0AAV5IF41_9ROSI|nr:hypothetical protein SLEP1_g13215 [Rubroshorea leprosula]
MNGFAQQAESMSEGMAKTIMSKFNLDRVLIYIELANELAVFDGSQHSDDPVLLVTKEIETNNEVSLRKFKHNLDLGGNKMKNQAHRWNTWGFSTKTTSLVSSLAAASTTGADDIARVWEQ